MCTKEKAKLKFDTNFLMNKIIPRENLIVKNLMIKFY